MEKRDDYKKKLVMICAIVILIFIGVWLGRFLKEENRKSTGKNVKTEAGEERVKAEVGEEGTVNNKALLEYGADRFDGRTLAVLFDLTNDGLDELIVYDDEEYTYPETDGVVTTFYIFSLIDSQVVEIDEISATPCEDICLYKEGGKYCLLWEEVSSTDVLTGSPGKMSFYRIQYDGGGKKQIIEEDSFQTEEEKGQRTAETNEKADAYKEKVLTYIKNSECFFYSGMWTTASDLLVLGEERPPFVDTTMEQLCGEYGIETIEKEASVTAVPEVPEEKEEPKEIAALGIYEASFLNARVGNGSIYYTVEDDYYDSMRTNPTI